jgi:hypothetical protein
MRKYFSGQMVSDIRNVITSSEGFKTASASASNESNIKVEQKLKYTVTDQ